MIPQLLRNWPTYSLHRNAGLGLHTVARRTDGVGNDVEETDNGAGWPIREELVIGRLVLRLKTVCLEWEILIVLKLAVRRVGAVAKRWKSQPYLCEKDGLPNEMDRPCMNYNSVKVQSEYMSLGVLS